MKKNFLFLAILLFMGGSLFTSCEKEDALSSNKEILSFVFEASKNPILEHNVIGKIEGTSVTVEVPFGVTTSNLIPSIEISVKAGIGPIGGVSTDFTNPVNYTVTAEDGSAKTFTVIVPVAPAPYIGLWETEASINIGNLGLSRVYLAITEEGEITMELKSTISGEIWGQSIKGHFDPLTVCNTEACIIQTHRWLDDKWTEETVERAMMYVCSENHMDFKYCLCYPANQWWYTVSLVKIE